jgi:hypothetical protein
MNKEMADEGCCGLPPADHSVSGVSLGLLEAGWQRMRYGYAKEEPHSPSQADLRPPACLPTRNAGAVPGVISSVRSSNTERSKPLPIIQPPGQLEFAPKLLSQLPTSSKFPISACLCSPCGVLISTLYQPQAIETNTNPI